MATHSRILDWRIPWTVYSPWGCKEPRVNADSWGHRSSAQGCTQRTPCMPTRTVVGFGFLGSLRPRWPQLHPAPGLQGGGPGQASPPTSELSAANWSLTSPSSVFLCASVCVCLSCRPSQGCLPSSPCSSAWSPARRLTSPTSRPGSSRLGSCPWASPLLLPSPFPDR